VAVALVAATALLLVPAGASAASPVLEFVAPGHSWPVSFTTKGGAVTAEGFEEVMECAGSSGEGKITGAHKAEAEFVFTECHTKGGAKCKSEGAGAEEIKTGEIGAELVYIAQAKHEVAILLNPAGHTYMEFKCGGIPARGEGSFLAPGAPLNTETTSFTTTLSKSSMSGGVQTPDEYEGVGGEKLKAIPLGEKNNNLMLEPTGVESTITVTTAEPVEVRAITEEEVEAKQREEAKKHEEALQTLETTLKKQEEALKKAEEHAKQVGEETKKHEEELNAQIVAIKKHQEEAAAEAKKDQEEVAATKKQLAAIEAKSQPPTRAQLLAKALKQCKKEPKNKRAQCEVKAQKKYGHKAKTGKQ
jgi:flagellar biosynthesis GTPase FlhF